MPKSVPLHHERFTGWVSRHGAVLHKLSRAYAPDAPSQGELHQEMLVQLWRSVPQFAGAAKESTWIYRVALNTALTWQRGRRRRANHEVPQAEPGESVSSGSPAPDVAHARQDLLEHVFAAVRALPVGERSLVVLSLDGLSYQEIGDITGLSENHVGVALSRARTKLANNMKGIRDELR